MDHFICPRCGKDTLKHAKGLCVTCYKKEHWKPKVVKCKRCEEMKPLHAKGFCMGCYNFKFQLQNIKNHQNKKRYNVDEETYNKITAKCVVCGFNKIVQLHHIDKNRENNSEKNLIGLCPNHHLMLHHGKHQHEIINSLKEKGFQIPENSIIKD